MNCGQDVDLRSKAIKSNNLDESLFILFSYTLDNQRFVPNENHTDICTCDSSESSWNENGLGEKSHCLLFIVEILLVDSRGVVLELGNTCLPIEEENSLFTI